ncbi:MAG TPA: hypothetical protein VEC35_00320 [Noviherbaspirillum sp.]|nr:hypothetical protein [Noviherbaspirillum sp.]
MHTHSPRNNPAASNAEFLRRVARRLLREAHSEKPSSSLPVLRRLLQSGVVPAARLTDLYHARESVQLKHMLRMIAAELGYPGWEACKHEIDRKPASTLDRFRLDLGAFGDYNQVWFSNEKEAQQWQAENGGQVVVYGRQAVVMTA